MSIVFINSVLFGVIIVNQGFFICYVSVNPYFK